MISLFFLDFSSPTPFSNQRSRLLTSIFMIKYTKEGCVRMKRNIIGFTILILFYSVFGYLIFGNIYMLLSGGVLSIFFITISSIIPIYLLYNDKVHNENYSKNNIILAVNITHILLVAGFIAFIINYLHYIDVLISPKLGYIVVGSSLVINIICLIMDIKKQWVMVTIGIHIVMFVIFILWEQVGYVVLGISFFYMISHNVFVVSYGILRYSQYFINKMKYQEEFNISNSI